MISKLELLNELENTLNNVQGVILSYSEANEPTDNYFKTYNAPLHVYGVNDTTNKFFNWSLQLLTLIERLENGQTIAPGKRQKLLSKLASVNRICNEALNGLEV